MMMLLKRGKETITLTNEIQIAAYKNSGFTEVKPTKKGDGKKGDDKNGAGETDGSAAEVENAAGDNGREQG